MAFIHISLFNLFFLIFSLFASDIYASFLGPHAVALGPEIFYMQRNKEGGSKQRGVLYGARFSYNRVKSHSLYWGADLLYASGTLNGHNSNHEVLYSKKRDSEAEGRLGYTFRKVLKYPCWFSPFLGGGYFEGTNRFLNPSPLNYKITTRFPYLTAGFLTRTRFNRYFSCGINFKTKYSVGAKGNISEKAHMEIDHSRFIIEDKFSYDLDFPLYFDKCFKGKLLEVSLVPFYRFRHYGAHDNHPFDFLDTRFNIYGARLMFGIYF